MDIKDLMDDGMASVREALVGMRAILKDKLPEDVWAQVDAYATTSFIAGKMELMAEIVERTKDGKL